VDASGNLYIADYSNNRIRKVNSSGIISTVAGNGTQAFSGDGGPVTSASLNGPTGVAVDAAGNLYVADRSNSRIRRVTPLA
jgi:DNA-binding beta-propeller fold protein YncE